MATGAQQQSDETTILEDEIMEDETEEIEPVDEEDSGKENNHKDETVVNTPKIHNHHTNNGEVARNGIDDESLTYEIPNTMCEGNIPIESSALSWIAANDEEVPIESVSEQEIGTNHQLTGENGSSLSSSDARRPSSIKGDTHQVFPDSITFQDNDDKSEGTRPDPPSTTDGRDAIELLNDMNIRTDEFCDPPDYLPTIQDITTPETTTRKHGEVLDDEENNNNDSFAIEEPVPSVLQTSREGYGADNLALLPPVEEERFLNHSPHLPYQRSSISSYDDPGRHSLLSVSHHNPERRKIQFRLCEEVLVKRTHKRKTSLLGTLRKNSTRMLRLGGQYEEESFGVPLYTTVERGTITVSWYNGTSSLELQQHVKRSVSRQLKVENPSAELDDFRILDESIDPPEGT